MTEPRWKGVLAGLGNHGRRWAEVCRDLAALTERREPECSGRDNLGTMAMAFAAVRSARQGGRRVRLAEIMEAAPGMKLPS